MAEDLWKYLQHVPNPNKKVNPVIKRKSEVTDKEVLNLTGGLFPLKLVDPAKDNPVIGKVDHWVYAPIRQKNPLIGPIYHWVKEDEEEKIYHGEKYNIEGSVTEFTEDQYSKIQVDSVLWPYSQVVDLFKKIKTYNYNFIVVHDRLENSKWTIEDIKDIYFTVSRLILVSRNQRDSLLSTYIYDKKYEINRKYELEKYLMRSKMDTDREKNLINEIRRLEILIKKEERQQINLKKSLKLDQIPEEIIKLNEITDVEALRKDQKVFTRQQLICKPIGLPGKIDDKLIEVLHGLNIPDKIAANQKNAELYDTLRKRILQMFSIQRYNRKKENEKRILEDKKKKAVIQEEDDRNNKTYHPLGHLSGAQPKKKQKS